MPETHWTSYVGILAGVIGMVTGVIGTILGWLAYVKANRMKRLDLRLEYRKAVNESNIKIEKLRSLISEASRSRDAVMAAKGIVNSGAMEMWKKELAIDIGKINSICASTPSRENDYQLLSDMELESELVRIDMINREIQLMTAKYESALLSDEKGRDQIRDDHNERSRRLHEALTQGRRRF